MDRVASIAGSVLRLLRERCTSLLADQTPSTELLDVLDQRQAAHHVSPCKLAQGIEVEMAVASMPAPSFLAG